MEAVARLNAQGYLVVVVTNQSGVARGYFSLVQVEAFHAEMRRRLADAGAWIDAFYVCPYHSEGVVEEFIAANHPDRKPNPGMILKALREHPIEAARSFLIGDAPSDLEAARAAGLPAYAYDGGDLDALVVRAMHETPV